MKREAPYKTEADLCAAFIAGIGKGWTAYAETAGWDILLVRKADGVQIGIEAKLKLNAEVVVQAIEGGRWHPRPDAPGPDYRAVLVPESAAGGLATVCSYVGITVITCYGPRDRYTTGPKFSPPLPHIDTARYEDRTSWHPQFPILRERLPDYVPDVVAGASGPVQLTEWKVKALRLCAILEKRGYVTRADFAALKLDHRRWVAGGIGWLVPGRDGWVGRGGQPPQFVGQHPDVYAKILEETIILDNGLLHIRPAEAPR
jgi:hypothetical protein